MSQTLQLDQYLPAANEIAPDIVLLVRQRLQKYLQDWWPELDTRPNSVFGDLYLTPMAVTVAALEIAYRRRDADLNLANVANGIVFNPVFVDGFLRNFGVGIGRAHV